MRLLDQVIATRYRNPLLVVTVDPARQFSECGAVAAQPIGVNDVWDIVFTQETGQERLRGLDIAMPLKQDVEHEAVLVYCSPQPVSDAIDARTPLVEMPP